MTLIKEDLIKHIKGTLSYFQMNKVEEPAEFWNGYLSYALELSLKFLKEEE